MSYNIRVGTCLLGAMISLYAISCYGLAHEWWPFPQYPVLYVDLFSHVDIHFIFVLNDLLGASGLWTLRRLLILVAMVNNIEELFCITNSLILSLLTCLMELVT